MGPRFDRATSGNDPVMAIRGRHVTQFTAMQLALLGIIGVVLCIALADQGWPALAIGLCFGGLFVVAVTTLIRNHRAGRTFR